MTPASTARPAILTLETYSGTDAHRIHFELAAFSLDVENHFIPVGVLGPRRVPTGESSLTLKAKVVRTNPCRTWPVLTYKEARATGDGQPSLMLVEADGGRWKIDAIGKIRAAMEAFNLNIPIIA